VGHTVGFKECPDGDVAFWAELPFGSLMRGFEAGVVLHLRRDDGALDVLGQEFGVAFVGNQGAHINSRRRRRPGVSCARDYPVSDLVNSPKTDNARCIEPVRIDRSR